MTKYDLITKIKTEVSHYLANNSHPKIDFKLFADIYDIIKTFSFTPDKKQVAINDKYGYIYEGSKIKLSSGEHVFFYNVFDNFVTMRYSGYYPFVIDLDRVNEKIEQIDRINNN